MLEISTLTKDDITSQKEIYEEIYEIESEVDRNIAKNKLLDRAKEIGAYQQARSMLKSANEEYRKQVLENLRKERIDGNCTDFRPDRYNKNYPVLYCGSYQATDYGIYTNEANGREVCPHPIIPVKRLHNIESGKEQVIIAYKRGDMWNEFTVPKSTIARASSIVSLADYGIGVNSENAKLLVMFLTTLELRNEDQIILKRSTSKLGWRSVDEGRRVYFMPYDGGKDGELEFDAESRFPDLYKSIKERGNYAKWLELAKEIRASNHIEARIAMAASFASVLVEKVGNLPFIVDFHGTTEGGKTTILMLAASIWANPSESKYIGDFKTTDVALEARCDVLHSLPVLLDDTSKAQKKISDNWESIVYDLCSGKGKSRSNKDIGGERERTWMNCIITNGERPLASFVNQGGAVNRIIEVECSEKLLDDPGHVADVVRRNYGFAGHDFVNYLKEVDDGEIEKLQESYEAGLSDENTMQKQVLAMTAILIADYLATEAIFQDGRRLTVDDVKGFLTNRNAVEEGSRCYQYILDIVAGQGQHFDAQYDNIDQWGRYWTKTINSDKNIKIEMVDFYPTFLDRELEKGGYNRKVFVNWALRHDLLVSQNGNIRKDGSISVRLSGEKKTTRIVRIILNPDFENEESGETPF